MTISSESRVRLLSLLRRKSVFHGDFALASGGRSSFYVDCKLTTLDPEGALLAGEVMYDAICQFAETQGIKLNAVGGLTMGADPLALAIGMHSVRSSKGVKLQVFSVRKSPKTHGQHKLVEGNFQAGDEVVIIDDVVTRGESTLLAIDAVEKAGGHVAMVAMLVDREEGGRQKICDRGYQAVSVFSKDEVLAKDLAGASTAALATA
jgi:orotate phosphoribosyltransferase